VIKIIKIIILISLLTLSCGEENVLGTEDDGISWDQISGRLAYKKSGAIYLIDGDSASIINLGFANLLNLKWNKSGSQITGVLYINDSTYSLEGIDLDGNRYILNNALETKYYDWLPDGSLVTISADGKLLIDGTILLNQTFVTVFGLACSLDGKKIVVSTDNIIENLLVEIDINSLSQKIIERNLNLFEPNFLQPNYSLEGDKVFYVTYKIKHDINGSHDKYSIWSIQKKQLDFGKDPCRSNNFNEILYTKVYEYSGKTIGIYSMNISDSSSIELIRGGYEPVWIY
jgi:hypothetical protein